MMNLILTACLTIPSYACRDSAVTIYDEMSEMQCAVTAQARIASWSEEHPNWRVVRWRCQRQGLAQKV